MRKTLGLADVVNAPDIIAGRDTVLVEARLGAKATDSASKDAYGAAKEMKAKAIAVEAYTGEATKYAELYKGFGDSFLGIIINKVTRHSKEREKSRQISIKVLAVIPEGRDCWQKRAELASVKGKINRQNAGELVELYAGRADTGFRVDYFKRKSKAAVIRQERADVTRGTETDCGARVSGQQPAADI